MAEGFALMPTLFIDPGELHSELVLQEMHPLADNAGGFAEIWNEVGLVWAHIEPVSDTARMFARQPLEEVTHRITLRWREGVTSGMRFCKGDRHFVIIGVSDPDESGRYLICRTREESR